MENKIEKLQGKIRLQWQSRGDEDITMWESVEGRKLRVDEQGEESLGLLRWSEATQGTHQKEKRRRRIEGKDERSHWISDKSDMRIVSTFYPEGSAWEGKRKLPAVLNSWCVHSGKHPRISDLKLKADLVAATRLCS